MMVDTGKLKAPSDWQPFTGKSNREWLREELADVQAMTKLACAHFDLALDPERIREKFEHKVEWLKLIHN